MDLNRTDEVKTTTLDLIIGSNGPMPASSLSVRDRERRCIIGRPLITSAYTPDEVKRTLALIIKNVPIPAFPVLKMERQRSCIAARALHTNPDTADEVKTALDLTIGSNALETKPADQINFDELRETITYFHRMIARQDKLRHRLAMMGALNVREIIGEMMRDLDDDNCICNDEDSDCTESEE